jgi:UrcA family protein
MTTSDNVRQVACLGAAGFVATALILAVAAPAHGQSYQKSVTVVAHKEAPTTQLVPYRDLALATKEGRRMLIRRVGLAVNNVCPTFDEDGYEYDVRGCVDFAWQGARPQIRRVIEAAKAGTPLAMSIEITSAAAK